jgi:HK97 family phage prohead protease
MEVPMPASPDGRERRQVVLDDIEVRADATGDAIRVEGHAAVFDKPAWIGPPKYGFSERFAKGAFKQSINSGADVRYLFNHNPDAVLARTKSGTLKLSEDRAGLAVDAELAPTSVGRDLAILMERGDVNQMSVGFRVVKDEWEEVRGADSNVYERRTILEAELFDVSAVTYPAYEETDAGLRAADLARELRDARGVHVHRTQTPEQGEPVTATQPAPPPSPGEPADHADDGTAGGPTAQPAAATATTPEPDVEERTLPLHDLLLRHASGAHGGAPRALCPACMAAQPATATA